MMTLKGLELEQAPRKRLGSDGFSFMELIVALSLLAVISIFVLQAFIVGMAHAGRSNNEGVTHAGATPHPIPLSLPLRQPRSSSGSPSRTFPAARMMSNNNATATVNTSAPATEYHVATS